MAQDGYPQTQEEVDRLKREQLREPGAFAGTLFERMASVASGPPEPQPTEDDFARLAESASALAQRRPPTPGQAWRAAGRGLARGAIESLLSTAGSVELAPQIIRGLGATSIAVTPTPATEGKTFDVATGGAFGAVAGQIEHAQLASQPYDQRAVKDGQYVYSPMLSQKGIEAGLRRAGLERGQMGDASAIASIAEGAGSSLPFMALGPLGLGTTAVAATGAAQGFHQLYWDAVDRGANPDQAFAAGMMGALSGSTEAIGADPAAARLGAILSSWDKQAGGKFAKGWLGWGLKVAGGTAKEGFEEGAQETGQDTINDVTLQHLGLMKPEEIRSLGQILLDNMRSGGAPAAVVGALFGGVGAALEHSPHGLSDGQRKEALDVFDRLRAAAAEARRIRDLSMAQGQNVQGEPASNPQGATQQPTEGSPTPSAAAPAPAEAPSTEAQAPSSAPAAVPAPSVASQEALGSTPTSEAPSPEAEQARKRWAKRTGEKVQFAPTLTPEAQAAVDFARDELGIAVHVVEGEDAKPLKAGGVTLGRTILIDNHSSAEQSIQQVLVHEITHAFANTDPEGFAKYVGEVTGLVGDQLQQAVNAYVASATSAGLPVPSGAGLTEEGVATLHEKVSGAIKLAFTDQAKLAEGLRKNRTLWQVIRDLLVRIGRRLGGSQRTTLERRLMVLDEQVKLAGDTGEIPADIAARMALTFHEAWTGVSREAASAVDATGRAKFGTVERRAPQVQGAPGAEEINLSARDEQTLERLRRDVDAAYEAGDYARAEKLDAQLADLEDRWSSALEEHRAETDAKMTEADSRAPQFAQIYRNWQAGLIGGNPSTGQVGPRSELVSALRSEPFDDSKFSDEQLVSAAKDEYEAWKKRVDAAKARTSGGEKFAPRKTVTRSGEDVSDFIGGQNAANRGPKGGEKRVDRVIREAVIESNGGTVRITSEGPYFRFLVQSSHTITETWKQWARENLYNTAGREPLGRNGYATEVPGGVELNVGYGEGTRENVAKIADLLREHFGGASWRMSEEIAPSRRPHIVREMLPSLDDWQAKIGRDSGSEFEVEAALAAQADVDAGRIQPSGAVKRAESHLEKLETIWARTEDETRIDEYLRRVNAGESTRGLVPPPKKSGSKPSSQYGAAFRDTATALDALDKEFNRSARDFDNGRSNGPGAQLSPRPEVLRRILVGQGTERARVDAMSDRTVVEAAKMLYDSLSAVEERSQERARQEARADANAALKKIAPEDQDPGNSGVRTLARAVPYELRNEGVSTFVGKTINGSYDLAVAAQVLRDWRFETFRLFYVDHAGKILAHEAVSSRLPGASQGFVRGSEVAKSVHEINSRVERLGAAGIWILHNHPGGNPKPSDDDINLTRGYVRLGLPILGHVVIDTTQYATINPKDGDTRILDLAHSDVREAESLARREHPLITGPNSVARHAVELRANAGQPVAVLASGQNRVQGVIQLPLGMFRNPTAVGDFLRGQARAFGTSQIYLHFDVEGIDRATQAMVQRAAIQLSKKSVIRDAVYGDGRSMLDMVRLPNGSLGLKKFPSKRISAREPLVEQYAPRPRIASRTAIPIIEGTEKLRENRSRSGDRPSVFDIAQAFDARAERRGYALPIVTEGMPAGERRAIEIQMSQRILEEMRYALSKPEFVAARGWYAHVVDAAMHAASEAFPTLKTNPDHLTVYKAILAITSNGQTVQANVDATVELFQKYLETGRISSDVGAGMRAEGISTSLELLQVLIDTHGVAGTQAELERETTVGQLKRRYKGLANVDGLVSDRVRGAAIFGPKIGSFYGNLNGHFDSLTADIWFTRTWNRHSGHMAESTEETRATKRASLREVLSPEGNARLSTDAALDEFAYQQERAYAKSGYEDKTPVNVKSNTLVKDLKGLTIGTPRNGTERSVMRSTIERVQKSMVAEGLPHLEVADIQAVLWYLEKGLYVRLRNANARAKATNYETATRAAAARILAGRGTADAGADGVHGRGERADQAQPAGDRSAEGARNAGGEQYAPRPAEDVAPEDEGPSTGIKFRHVDEQLAAMGFDPSAHDETITFQEHWDVASSIVANDPHAGQKLLADLERVNRPPTALEATILAFEMNRLINARDDAEARYVANRTEANAEAVYQAKAAYALAADITTRAGTAAGQALAFRRMMLNRDYSLARMERAVDVASGGDAGPDAMAEVRRLHDRMRKAEADIRDLERRMSESRVDRTISKIAGEERAKTDKVEKRRSAARKEIAALDSSLDELFKSEPEAPAASAEKFAPRPEDESKLNPKILEALVQHAKLHRRIGYSALDAWAEEVIKKHGERARPYLAKAWAESEKRAQPVKPTPTVRDRIKARIKSRAPMSSLFPYVRQLAREFIGAGITDRDQLVDAVHSVLREFDPNITRRQAMDAISGYGEFRPISQEEVARTLRDLRAQLQQVGKLEDMQAGIPPKKTGLERDIPSDEVRRLIKKVNEAKKRLGFQSASAEDQLRGALDAIKTRLRNQINDLQYQIDRGEQIVEDETPPPSDAEVEALRTRRDELQSVYDQVFAPQGPQPDRRAIQLQRQIEDLQKRIDTGDLEARSTQKQGPQPEHIQRLIDERDALQKQLDEARKAAKPVRTQEEIDAAKVRSLIAMTEKSIAEYERRIRERDLAPKPQTPTPTSPELDALRARRTALAEELALLRMQMRPTATPEEKRLQAYKTRVANDIAALREKVFYAQFEAPSIKAKPEPVELDAEATALAAEQKRLKTEFGRLVAAHERANRSRIGKVVGVTKDVVDLNRAVLASWDLSAMFRQGAFFTIGHPVQSAKAVPGMVRAAFSEKTFQERDAARRRRPIYPFAVRSGLEITEMDGPITAVEEAIHSRLSDRLPGIRGSNRAFTDWLNEQRLTMFERMVEAMPTTPTVEEGRAIANAINVGTGRGATGHKFAQAVANLGTFLWAPRLLLSRFQLLAGQPLYGGTAATRKIVAKEYARFLLGIAALYALSTLAGNDPPELDPRSSDFGKIKIGSTRIDPLAGLAQVTVLLGRELSGERKKLSGEVVPIRGEAVPYGSPNAWDVATNFLRTKLTPLLGTGVDIAVGKNLVGEPVTAAGLAERSFVPLSMQDILQMMREHGAPKALGLQMLSIFGFGVNSYGLETEFRANAAQIDLVRRQAKTSQEARSSPLLGLYARAQLTKKRVDKLTASGASQREIDAEYAEFNRLFDQTERQGRK